MGLKEDLDRITVGELNLRQPVTVVAGASVREAVAEMRKGRLGCALVVDNTGKAVGLFTEGILRHGLNDSPDFLNSPVADQVASQLPWVLPSDPVRMVLDAMEEHNIRFIAVLDEEQKPLGITGQKSLIEFIAEYFPHEVLTQDPTGASIPQQKEGA